MLLGKSLLRNPSHSHYKGKIDSLVNRGLQQPHIPMSQLQSTNVFNYFELHFFFSLNFTRYTSWPNSPLQYLECLKWIHDISTWRI